jgi:outer membrane protein TolC
MRNLFVALVLLGLSLGRSAAVPTADAQPAPSSDNREGPLAPDARAPATTDAALTLFEAIRLAQARHEDPRIAVAQLERAEAVRRQAFATLLPRLTISGTYNRRANEVVREFNGESVAIQRFNALNSQAVLESSIFDARSIPLLRSAAESLRASELDAAEVRRALSFSVAETYFGVLGFEQLAGAARERLALADETVADARRRLAAGLAASGEVIRAELEQASSRVTLAETRRQVEVARLALGLLVVQPIDGPLEEPPELAVPTGSDLPEKAADSRQDLEAAGHRVESLRQLAMEPWFRLFPALTLRALSSATNEPGFGPATNWNIAVTLSWTLFDGGARYAEAAAADADVSAAMLSTDKLRRLIAHQVRSAQTNLEAARKTLAEAVTRAAVARRNSEDVRIRQRAGLASALELADAAVSAFEADSGVVRQRFALRQSQLALLEALGHWAADDRRVVQ